MTKHRPKPILITNKKSNFCKLIVAKRNLFIILGIFLYSLCVWWPTRSLPYHWDSAGFVINAARQLESSNFQPFIVNGSDFAHPPLLIAMLAFIWKVFGHSLIISHLVMFPFLPVLMIAVYCLGKKSTNNIWIGLGSSLLTGMLPFVVGEYGMIYIDLPMAALTLSAFALWIYNKRLFSVLVLSLAALIKFPALLLLIIFGWLIFKDQTPWKEKVCSALLLLLPITVVALWLVYHYQITGWWLTQPERLTNQPKNIDQAWSSFSYIFSAVFLKQSRFLLSLIGFGSIVWMLYKKNRPSFSPIIQSLILFLSISVLFFTGMGEFGLRYSIFFTPMLIILSLHFFWKVINNIRILLGTIAVIALCFGLTWHPKISQTAQYEFQPSENLSYTDIITIGEQAAQFVSINHPKAHIYGAFPESYQLTQPYQGYVKTALNYSECQDFKPESDKDQIIYIHPYSPGQTVCRQLLELIPAKPLQHFESNGKWVEIYLVEKQLLQKNNKPS